MNKKYFLMIGVGLLSLSGCNWQKALESIIVEVSKPQIEFCSNFEIVYQGSSGSYFVQCIMNDFYVYNYVTNKARKYTPVPDADLGIEHYKIYERDYNETSSNAFLPLQYEESYDLYNSDNLLYELGLNYVFDRSNWEWMQAGKKEEGDTREGQFVGFEEVTIDKYNCEIYQEDFPNTTSYSREYLIYTPYYRCLKIRNAKNPENCYLNTFVYKEGYIREPLHNFVDGSGSNMLPADVGSPIDAIGYDINEFIDEKPAGGESES